MGRGKIEREINRGKKKDFRLEGTQEGGEQQWGLLQKRQEKEQPRGSYLEKKKIAKRELCVEKKIKSREQSVAAFEGDN